MKNFNWQLWLSVLMLGVFAFNLTRKIINITKSGEVNYFSLGLSIAGIAYCIWSIRKQNQ